jgi:hypothetical protein
VGRHIPSIRKKREWVGHGVIVRVVHEGEKRPQVLRLVRFANSLRMTDQRNGGRK